jgi:hypothetical protein
MAPEKFARAHPVLDIAFARAEHASEIPPEPVLENRQIC